MKTEDYQEQTLELAGWPAHMVSYRLGEKYYAKVDNVSPGALVARAEAATKEEAERVALEKAERRLAATRKHDVATSSE